MTGEFNFKDVKAGDTYNKVDFEIISSNNIPVDLTGVTIKMQFRNYSDVAVKTFEIGTGFTITNASLGKFSLETGVLNVAPDHYFHDIQITFPTGRVITYLEGRINITPDVSR